MIRIQTPTIKTGAFNFQEKNSYHRKLVFPELHSAQQPIASNLARFNVINCGRRFGKSMFGTWLCKPAEKGQRVGWFSPTYKILLEVWQDLVRIFTPIKERISVQEKRIELTTGGIIEMWSLSDNPDAGRSRKYHRAIIDEAAMIARLKDAWQQAIRPTLTDYLGDAFFLSTPKGLNYYKTLYDYGKDPLRADWRSWQLPTSANPYIQQSEINAAKQDLAERIFQQEYLAEFIDDDGLFRRVTECATASEQDPVPGRRYAVGVDWGKHNDFTAIVVIDIVTSEMVFIDRFNQIDYSYQSDRLKRVVNTYKPQTIIAESNAMGEPIIDQLRRDGIPARPFQTTNASKSRIINALSLAFEQQSIKIIPDPVLIPELQAFEATRLPSGALRYAAPSGQHDDTVMALALAYEACHGVEWSDIPQSENKPSPWDISGSKGGSRWQL